jgi:hypothetical protein
MLFLLLNFVLIVEMALVTLHTGRLTSTVMLSELADPARCSQQRAPVTWLLIGELIIL